MNGTLIPRNVRNITGYKVYRKEQTELMMKENPNMLAKERRQEVNERWHKLESKEKYVYVLKSELERKKRIFEWVQNKIQRKIAHFESRKKP